MSDLKNRENDRSLSPFSRALYPMSLVRNELECLFDDFLGRFPAMTELKTELKGGELTESDREVMVKLELPGFEPGELDIQVRGDRLVITAEHLEESDKGRSVRRMEHSWLLPAPVVAAKAEGTYAKGMLELKLPKAEVAPAGHKIPVKAA